MVCFAALQVRDEFRKCLEDLPYSVTNIDIVPERLKTAQPQKRFNFSRLFRD